MRIAPPAHLFVPTAVIHPWTSNYIGWGSRTNIPLIVMACDLRTSGVTKQYAARIWRSWTFSDQEAFRDFFRRWDMKNKTLQAFPDENRIEWSGTLNL